VASRRNVKLGYTSGDSIELIDGLAEGDQIITVGRAALRDGSLIDVIPAEAGKTASADTGKGRQS
jgi:membrane fusion protein (multidrug efflux system)